MRALHDSDLDEPLVDPLTDEEGPGYPAVAALVRARMDVLPAPNRARSAARDSGIDPALPSGAADTCPVQRRPGPSQYCVGATSQK